MIRLTNKNLVELQKFASASIIEETDGTFSLSSRDTSAMYVTILSLNKSLLKTTDFNLPNQDGSFYMFNTSMINNFIDKYKLLGFNFTNNGKSGHNGKSGNSGNMGRSYLSISNDNKIINQAMYNILNKAEIKIVLVKESNKYLLDINSVEDWNNFFKLEGYKPLRFFIKNVSANECCTFYLKPVNAYLKGVYDSLIDKFSSENGLLKMNSKEIRETFDINIGSYIDGVSNDNFYVKVNGLDVERIYCADYTYLFFPYDIDDIHFYDNYSFYKNEYVIKSNFELFEKIDPMKLYSEGKGNKNIDPIVFFNRCEMKKIHYIIEKNTQTSKDVLLNESDTSILSKLPLVESDIFEVVPNKENKHIIRIKSKEKSNIEVSLYDRKHKRQDNVDNQITWFTAINEGLSFEREKTLSIFYIQNFVNKLREQGHVNIKIELEKPVLKKDGRQGFLDSLVTSTFNDVIYGQVFEFKAVYNWNEENYEEQRSSYDITHSIIDIYNLSSSYDGLDYNSVKLLNLI